MIALVSAVAVLMAMVAIYAPPAKAHHPTTTANVVCDGPDVAVSYTSTSWQLGEPGHNDIRIQVSVNGGDWTEVASGAYNAGNGYSFSGAFDATPYVGESIQIRSWANGAWTNGAGAGNSHPDATTAPFTVTDNCGPDDVNVTVGSGVCEVVQGQAAGSVDVTITPASGATVTVYSDAGLNDEVGSLTETGSLGGLAPSTYYWIAEAADGFDIDGASSGQVTIDPCDVTVSVTGVCVVDGDVGSGEITVTISVDGGATVIVSDGNGPVATLTETGTVPVLEGASYSWTASPNPGFTISGDDSGSVDIEECSPPVEPPPEEPPPVVPPEVGASISVTVEGTCEVTDGVGRGEIDVTIAVADGATVTITDESGAVVGTFTSDGTLSVPEGASYSWVATPSDGFEFPVGFEPSGTIDIDGCTPDEVMASIQVTVSGICELDGDEGEGFVDISMSVPDGATVVVRDSDGDVVGTVTDDATLSVPEGATYTWAATASEGFEFPPGFDSSGSITIERCSDPETLPFTGFDPYLMAVFAILLMGAGVAAMYFGPREEGS